jgi:endonuclease/exonuclease/phosphatase family metal-dependent hydrolase
MLIRVLTYNIHKGFATGNLRFVLPQIRDQLREANVDLAFLQEIQGQHTRKESRIKGWPLESQFEFLADELWPHFAYGKNAIYNHGHHGNAILSKHPFSRWDNINVSHMRRASRSLLHGVVTLEGRTLHVVCIHLDLFTHHRQRQLGILSQYIADHVPMREPLIVAGDFNDWTGEAERFLARDLRLTEIFREAHGRYARTFPAWFPVLPVDRVPGIETADLADASLYRVLEDVGVRIVRSDYTVRSEAAAAEVADLLEIAAGAPVLVGEELASDLSGTPVNLGRVVYRSDAYEFQATLFRPFEPSVPGGP